jgi:hypothetical protein
LSNNNELRTQLSKYYPEETFTSIRLAQIKKRYEGITGSKSNLEVPTGGWDASDDYKRSAINIKKPKINKKVTKNNINNDIIVNENGITCMLVKRLYSYEEVKIDNELIKDIKKYKWYFNASGAVVARKKVKGILKIVHLANLVLQKSEYYRIGYKNGYKYDCRIENLYIKDEC